MSNRLPDLAFAAAAAALGIGIVFVFRSMYLAEDILPFAQEMTLIFLGAVVTIILTAALLNRQTDLELRKEGRVIILQQQCDIYMACIEKVAEIVETARHDAKLIDDNSDFEDDDHHDHPEAPPAVSPTVEPVVPPTTPES